MFRKNYLPKVKIMLDRVTGKYTAVDGDGYGFISTGIYRGFLHLKDPTSFDTLEKLLEHLYSYAAFLHAGALKRTKLGRLVVRL